MDTGTQKQLLEEQSWYSLRHGTVEEVEVQTTKGPVTRYRVLIWDEGREPFVRQMFNDPAPAMDFLERVKDQNEQYHDVRLGGRNGVD